MSRVLAIQHIEAEPMGTLESFFQDYGIEYDYVRVFEGNPVPRDPSRYDALVVMGGPMNVDEAIVHRHLVDEVRLIRAAIHGRKTVLGICLGAQLIAKALRAPVYDGESGREVGWAPIRLTPEAKADPAFATVEEDRPTVLHWHGQTFDLPDGAVRLAYSDMYKNQAFRCGDRVYGFQFHVEVTDAIVEEWVRTFPCDAPERIRAEARKHVQDLRVLGRRVFRGVFRFLPEVEKRL
ncbi:MAG: type 1 glutamine amidotransferase [Candidatus Methylomirabilis sp.]|nr:type 1 glutamine amidotransferase [Deltaproteobacteria bacterium]